MSGNGSPAHRAGGSAQRNRLIAVGAGLLLALILLFSLLAFCTNPDEPAAGPAGSVGPSATGSPGAPNGGEAAPAPSTTVPVVPPGDGASESADPGAGPTATDDVATEDPGDDPEQTSTPEGGVDAGGGSLVSGQRLALLVTGGFLLVAAGAAGAYALRRPLHHH
jgi:hypothetical protein